MLFQTPNATDTDWITTILIALAVPAFGTAAGLAAYLGKRYFERKPNRLADELKETEIKAKIAEIESKSNTEKNELGDRLMKAVKLNTELGDELQAKSQTIIDNQKTHLEQIETLQGEKEVIEIELRETTEAFTAEKKLNERRVVKIQSLLAKAKIALWMTDGCGKQIYVGEAFYGIFGTTADNPDAWTSRVVQADLLRINDEWKRFIADMETVSAIKFRKIGDDGGAVDCISIYTTVRDSSGEVIEVWGLTLERK